MANIQTDKTPIQRLIEIVQIERQDIGLLVALTFGYGLLNIATPVAVQALVNIVTMGGVLQPLFVVSLILFALLLLSGMLYVYETYLVELIQRRIFIRTAVRAAMNSQGIQTTVYDSENPVELMNRFFDISTVQKAAATLLTVGLTAFLQGLIGSLILIFYSLYFAIIVIGVVGMLAIIIFVLGRRGIPTAIDESITKYKMAAWLETIARNFYMFKFYRAAQRTATHTDDLAKEYLERREIHFQTLLLQNIGAVLLYALVGTSMLALGGGLVIQGQINLGQFVAAELIIFGVLAAFVRFISKLEYFYDMLAALDKIGVLNDLPQETIGEHVIENTAINTLIAHEVSFGYSPRIQPIQDLSFSINKGQSLAVLGASGAGKSTLVGILLGLRAPSVGHISYNGMDLRQLNQTHLRNMIGIASRVEILEGTILENIRVGRSEITLVEINEVLAELGLLSDFANLEKSLDTELTAFGAPLSTTQLQRLMLARAIVGKPSMLIIDGLLDTLDEVELEAVIQLLTSHKQAWMLIVTTRFASIAQQFDMTLLLPQQKERA
jgi:ABC-type bacteriocin/lantibiotic exporter with double-glycine peptidase domain